MDLLNSIDKYRETAKTDNSTNASISQKYGFKMQQPVAQSNFNTSDPSSMTRRDYLGRIAEIAQTDKRRADNLYQQYTAFRSDPSSPIYAAYAQPTSPSIKYLTELGIDISTLDDKWYEQNGGWLRSNLIYDGTTTTPTKPGKKATKDQQAAYWIYQFYDDNDLTKKAEEEYQAVIDEAKYWAGFSDRNMSDQEVYDQVMLNFDSKYPTLAKMRDSKQEKPLALTRAVDYSDDVIWGGIWMGRNGDYTGGIEGAMASSALGRGNQWEENPEIDTLLHPFLEDGSVNPNFKPYALGSTNMDSLARKYGVYSFGPNCLEEYKYLRNGSEEDQKAYQMIETGENNYLEAEAALKALEWWRQNRLNTNDPVEAKKQFDRVLARGKITYDDGTGKKTVSISILNDMDLTMGKDGAAPTGNLIPMTRGINYKYSDYLQSLYDDCDARGKQETGEQIQNNPTGEPETVQQPETQPEQTEEEQQEPEQEAGTGQMDLNPDQAEQIKGMIGGPEEEQKAPPEPTQEPAPQFSQGDIDLEKMRTQLSLAALDAVSSIIPENEGEAWKNAPSVDWEQSVDFWKGIKQGADSAVMTAMGQNNLHKTVGNFIDSSLANDRGVYLYGQNTDTLAECNKEIDALKAKYGENIDDLIAFESGAMKTDDSIHVGRDAMGHDTWINVEYDKETGRFVVSGIEFQGGGEHFIYDLDELEEAADSGLITKTQAQAYKDLAIQANKIVDEKNDKLGEITATKERFEAAGEQGAKDLDAYKQYAVAKANSEKYLADNEQSFQQQRAAMYEARMTMSASRAAAEWLGLDTSSIDKAQEMLDFSSGFYEEPTLYNPATTAYDTALTAYNIETGEPFTAEERSAHMHSSIEQIDAEIKRTQDALAYYEQNGYQLPDNMKKNMGFYLDDLEYMRQQYEYGTILTDTPPEELDKYVEMGKAWEEKYANFGYDVFDDWESLYKRDDLKNSCYPLKYNPMYEGDDELYYTGSDGEKHPIRTKEDDTIYYYLLGKKVEQYGDQLTEQYDNASSYGDEVGITVHNIIDEANDYAAFMIDPDHGPWLTRTAFERAESARDTVNSGGWGGLGANLASTVSTPVESILNAKYLIEHAVTGRRMNPYATERLLSTYKQSTRETTFKSIDDMIKDPTWNKIIRGAYEIYVNRGDSFMNQLAFGWMVPGSGIMSQIFGALPMAFTAAVDTMTTAVERGANVRQTWILGAVSLVFESVTEGLTYGNIKDALGVAGSFSKETVKDLFINWLTSSGPEEMFGESITDIAEKFADHMVSKMDNPNYKSEHQALIDKYIAEGWGDQAEAKAFEQEVNDVKHTAIISFISPILDVGGGVAKSALNTVKTLNAVRNYTRADQKLGGSRSTIGNTVDLATGKRLGMQEKKAVAATPSQQEAAKDIATIERSASGDASAKSSAVASSLDTGEGTDASNDRANAASVYLGSVLGSNRVSTVMQEVMKGAGEAGVDVKTVKKALQNAALGNGSATALLKSNKFQNMTPTQKAHALADTVALDDANGLVQKNISKKVHEFRVSREMPRLANEGVFDQAKADQAKAEKAAAETAQAETMLEEKQGEQEAATAKFNEAKEALVSDSGNDQTKKQYIGALTDAKNADIATHQMEQHLENTKQAQVEAEAKAKESTEKAMATARESAEAAIAEQDQQRADIAAKNEQAQREAEEAERQRQAEEDERTGKAQEDRDNAAIEESVGRENLSAEESENKKEDMVEQKERVKIKLRDLSKPLTDAEGALAIYALERKLGIKINMADMGQVTKRGWTRGMYSNGEITLNQNMTIGQAVVEAALHEITHSMKNTKSYEKYRDIVLRSVFKDMTDTSSALSMYENNKGFQTMVNEIIAERIAAGDQNFVGQSHENQIQAAEEEIIADFARLNLAEKDVVQRFMDAGMGGRMRNTLHNINQALKNYLSNMTGAERQTAEAFRRAERAFQKAINEVAKASVHPEGEQFSVAQIAQSAGMTFDEKTLTLYDRDGKEINGVNNKITPDMITETPVGMLIMNGLTGEQQQKAMDMMAGLMNMVARYKDSNLVWEIGAATLSSTFSAIKSNSDPQYKTTVDFGTVCAKTQAIIDVMSKVMLDRVANGQTGGLTRQEIMTVYDEVNKAKLSVPCPVCYVFSRWMGVPSLLGQMSQYQNDYVVVDESGKIDKVKTQEKVDQYIATAEEKYGDAKAINNKKAQLHGKQAKLEQQRMELEARSRNKTLSEEERAAARIELKDVLGQMVELDKQIGEVSAYNWITQALCKKDKNGKFVVDSKFKLTPDEILFDLNRTGEFAGYEKNWAYRNTRGAGMGKAIMPYSGETIGDVLYGVKKGGRQNAIKNPWLNMDGKAALRQLRDARNRARKQNLVGGQRLQSTSDFRPEWGLDYIMSFLELQAAGSKVQMYTKVAEAVDFFASVGADVNLSIMGKGQGWHINENGEYVLDFSDITGMKYETAKALKDKYDNVQMILVGMNDTHIRLAMANSDIDFIIPWHSSGNSKETLAGLIAAVGEKLDSSVDYTKTQTDMVKGTKKTYRDEKGEKVEYTAPGEQTAEQKALWDARVKLLTKGGDKLTASEIQLLLSNDFTRDLYYRFTTPEGQDGHDPECYGVKLSAEQAKQIFPYEYWDRSSTKETADINGKRFADYCEAMGIVPRFSQFKDDPGYWKLLIDRPMYDNNGNYRSQSVVDVTNAQIGNLNESGQLEDSDLPTQAQAKYAPKDPRSPNYQEYTAREQQAIDNAEAALAQQHYEADTPGQMSVYGELTEADRAMMREAEEDYDAAIARGDMVAAQEDVEFYSGKRGYTEKAYHGSDDFGFTEFDLEQGQGTIFVSYQSDIARTYTRAGDVKAITESNLDTASNETLANLYGGAMRQAGNEIEGTVYNEETGTFDVTFDDGTVEQYTREEVVESLRTFDQDFSDMMSSEDPMSMDTSHYVDESLRSGIYELYTRPGKQLVIDGQGAPFGETPVPWTDKKLSTREIAEYARANGYDSVRINNIIDRGHHFERMEAVPRDIGIFFRQDDVKSADVVTRDNDGKIIPLDKRFTDNSDIRYSEGGELTEADRELLRRAGIDASAEERINRQTNQQEKAIASLSEWTDGSGKTVKEVIDLLGDSLYPSLEKWLHNTYQKGYNKRNKTLVTKDAIQQFIDQDAEVIKNGSASLINGWSQLINEGTKWTPIDLDSDQSNASQNQQIDVTNDKDIAGYLFSSKENLITDEDERKKGADFYNKDTKSKIRFNRSTINESFHWARQEGIDPQIMGKVLMQSADLLNNAKYIGSHPDYVHPGTDASIHYLVSSVYVDGEYRAVLIPVHDSTSGNTQFSDKAYVVEFEVIDKENGVLGGDLLSGQDNTLDLYQATPSEVSITDILRTVNTDRLRSFDKESLKGSQVSLSTGGEMTEAEIAMLREAELNKALQETGVLTQEEVDAYNEKTSRPKEGMSTKWRQEEGPAQRQFGGEGGMLENATEIEQKAIDYVQSHNAYFPDTNADQINRALNWIRKNGSKRNNDGTYTQETDGYNESIDKVISKSFDYRSADGQARMIAVMAMAAAKNDIRAQTALADAFNRQGTDLGRALQARKIFRMMTPEGRIASIQKMVDDMQADLDAKGIDKKLTFSDWILRAASVAKSEADFRQVQQAAASEIASQIPANWRDKLRGWRMLSMLGNPRTHIRNVVGNALFIPAVGMKNKVAALMELGMENGKRTKTLAPFLSKEAREFAKQDALNMKDMLTGEAKFNETNMIQKEQKAFNGLLQAVIDFNGDMLEKEDWLFLKGHYKRALGGWMMANGYTADQLKSNPELLEQGRAYAIQEAQKATYRDFNQLAATLNQVSRNGGLAGFITDAVLPFKKTPANILRRGIEYSPVNLMKSITTDLYHLKQWNDYQDGKLSVLPDKAISPNQWIDRTASGLTGTMIMVLGALLNGSGLISTGLGDDDDKFEKEQGNQPYAIKIAGKTFTLDWAAPMAMPFFVGAAIREQLENKEGFSVEKMLNAMGNIAEPVFNLSMLDGVNSLFKTSSYDDTSTLTQIAAKIGTNYATSYVPSLLGAIARTVDDTRRKSYVESGKGTGILGTVRYAREQVENKIPGLSQTNIPYRDVFGNPETSGLAERILENFILPGYVTDYKNDPVLNEMARLYDANVEGSASMVPEYPKKTVTYNKQKYTLTAEQWDTYCVERGQTAYKMLTDLIATDDYKNATPEEQIQMIKKAWTYADSVGKAAIIPGFELEEKKDPVASVTKEGKIQSNESKMMTCLENEDYEGYETMVEALHEEGVEDHAIKDKIGDKWRDQYKAVYREYLAADSPESRQKSATKMKKIEDMLDNTDYNFDYYKWQEQVDNEADKED